MPAKVALVTGASSDIGASLVRELLAQEFQVYGHYHSNKSNFKSFEANANFAALHYDLKEAPQAALLIKQVLAQSGRLDFLVNAIGPLHHKPILEMTPGEWQEQIHFNLNIAFYLAHHAQAALIEAKGQIVNFSFAGAETLSARPTATPYCAAKAGIVVLTKSLATALAPFGVRVNAISPGLIEKGPIESPERQLMANSIPFGRPGTPEEAAAVLRWLLCASPSYITGALIPVAGAWEYL